MNDLLRIVNCLKGERVKLSMDYFGSLPMECQLVYKADAIKQEPFYRDASLYKVHPDGLDTLLHEPLNFDFS